MICKPSSIPLYVCAYIDDTSVFLQLHLVLLKEFERKYAIEHKLNGG